MALNVHYAGFEAPANCARVLMFISLKRVWSWTVCHSKRKTKHHEAELWEGQSGKLVSAPLQITEVLSRFLSWAVHLWICQRLTCQSIPGLWFVTVCLIKVTGEIQLYIILDKRQQATAMLLLIGIRHFKTRRWLPRLSVKVQFHPWTNDRR